VQLTDKARTKESPFHLDYFKQTIFVDIVAGGSGVYSSTGVFVLDTGATNSAIDEGIVGFLDLKCEGTTNDWRQTGSVRRQTCVLPKLTVLGHAIQNLTVVKVDEHFPDLDTQYERRIDGILGMDFLKNFVLMVDFPKRTIALLDNDSIAAVRSRPFTIEMKPCEDLWLVSAKLPTGKTVDLLFDTGEDAPADAILFKPLVGPLTLKPPISAHYSNDTLQPVPTQHGQLDFLKISKLTISPAVVGLVNTASVQVTFFPHAGRIGLYAFDRGRIVADFKKNRLLFTGSAARRRCWVTKNGICKY
jgi:hypothetical protein